LCGSVVACNSGLMRTILEELIDRFGVGLAVHVMRHGCAGCATRTRADGGISQASRFVRARYLAVAVAVRNPCRDIHHLHPSLRYIVPAVAAEDVPKRGGVEYMGGSQRP
jgi:hypothetical protein